MDASDDVSKSPLLGDIAAPLLDALLKQAPIGITIAAADNVEILRVSDYGSRLLGRQRQDLEHITADQHVEAYRVYDPITGLPAAADRLPLTRATQLGELVVGEEWLVGTEDGRLIPIICNAGPIRSDDNAIVGGVIAWSDLSRQKRLEEELRAAIVERDAARAELNHRVKNHLSLVSALIQMEARTADSATDLAGSVSQKITALANAYSALERQPENAAPARDLLQAVALPLATPSVKINVHSEPDQLVPARLCAPLGIIINEAVCNALKHGFRDGRNGRIDLSLQVTSGHLTLTVANDGLPIASEHKRKGQGTRFIASLVRQLHGTFELRDLGGAGVSLEVRLPSQ